MSESTLRLKSYSGVQLDSPQHDLWVEKSSKLITFQSNRIASVFFRVSKCDRCFQRNSLAVADMSCCLWLSFLKKMFLDNHIFNVF